MTTRALHMRRPRREGEGLDLRFSLCGMVAVDVTDSHVEVTCRLCQRALAEAVVVPVEETLGVEVPAVIGARRVDAIAHRIIARSVSGEDTEDRPRFYSERSLHDHWSRVSDDGSPVRSTSDPDKFGARAQSSGGAVRMPSGRDDMIECERALLAATVAPISVGPHIVDGERQRAIYLGVHWGRPHLVDMRPNGKVKIVTRAQIDAVHMVCEVLRSVTGDEWTPHQVAIVRRSVSDAFVPICVEKRLLPTSELRKRREDKPMKVPGYDLDGWKEIADALGCSVDTAREYNRSKGMPAKRLTNGRWVASRAEVRAWLSRQTTEAA